MRGYTVPAFHGHRVLLTGSKKNQVFRVISMKPLDNKNNSSAEEGTICGRNVRRQAMPVTDGRRLLLTGSQSNRPSLSGSGKTYFSVGSQSET